ncbi:MAG: hypothetical protein K2L46_03535 [Paramuribaculum sp.]|nr:hypothetical protein [Paramuribaculum sp.]MDE6323366.1 hypothetical protein [Paramuribaculum sp.]MDE6488330.1 hypothetical protein [Paramuribaculum sp.]
MIRIFLSLLIILAVASGHAQGLSSGTKALRGLGRSSNSSRQIVRQLEQQSRRAEQTARAASEAARAATAAGALKFKLKPSGLPIAGLNPDKDDEKQNYRIAPRIITPTVHKFKTPQEIQDDRIASRYDSIKALVNSGVYVPIRFSYFQLADYAMRHDDEPFAITCLERARIDRLTPEILEWIGLRYKALSQFMPEISRVVAISAYYKMIDAKLKGTDCASARMQQGDTLLMVTSEFNPSLNPLVVLSCFYDPSKEVMRYKEAADSVIATYDQWSDAFKDIFASDFLITLIDNGEHAAALDYFGREPLKTFPDTRADFTLDMAGCAYAAQNDTLFFAYLDQASVLDSVATEDYLGQLYKASWDQYLADPLQIELADWLILLSPVPANNALLLSLGVLERIQDCNETSWEWADIDAYTPEQSADREAILHILDKGLAVDDGRSQADVVEWCRYFKAYLLLSDPSTLAEGNAILEALAMSNNPELRCNAIIQLAYIAAHGLDNPKDGLKILKKNIKLLEDPAVDSGIRSTWYDYMAALATRLGKTKDAEKFNKLKEKTNNSR